MKIKIRDIAKIFPWEEKFRLSDQIIRSAGSENFSTAEGDARCTFPDKFLFCIIRRSSLSEAYNHIKMNMNGPHYLLKIKV